MYTYIGKVNARNYEKKFKGPGLDKMGTSASARNLILSIQKGSDTFKTLLSQFLAPYLRPGFVHREK